jgi:preprotein translocase subunit SecD
MQRRLLASLIGIVLVAVVGVTVNVAAGNSPTLGLDLQGGASVTLEPAPGQDYDAAAIDVAVDVIRQRVDSLGVAEPEIYRQGQAVVVNLPGVKDQNEALALVSATGNVLLRPVLNIVGTVDQGSTTTVGGGGPTVVPTTTAAPGTTVAPEVPDTTAAPGPPRATPTEPATTVAPGTTSAPETLPPELTVPPTAAPTISQDVTDPTATTVVPGRDGLLYLVGPAAATGEVLQNDAQATIINGEWVVVVGLRPGAAGEAQWNAIALQCYNRTPTCPTGQLAIQLDEQIVSAPTVQTPQFAGEVQITGSFSEREASELARILKFGAVPVTLEPQAVQTVSATLGEDSLRSAVIAGLVGMLLVIAYLFLYYRSLAIVVVGGLAIFVAVNWTVITILSQTSGLALSLAGAAGIIVSIGITVDSYVVYFERLKDEVRSGRTLRNSAERGFRGAWRTILVADSVSLLAAAVLWYLTVGSVRGFAFFLGLATICDMVVAWFYTRPAVLLLARSRWFQGRKLFGITGAEVAPAITGGTA